MEVPTFAKVPSESVNEIHKYVVPLIKKQGSFQIDMDLIERTILYVKAKLTNDF